MVVGLGIDLVAVGRIKRLRERHGDRFLTRIYTAGEVAACLGRKSPDEGLAARFAAKEAALKALGTGVAHGVGWRDVEVVSSPEGRPGVAFHGRALTEVEGLGVTRSLLSLTHDGAYAGAVVVLERREDEAAFKR